MTSSGASSWAAERNARSSERLHRALPALFPRVVLQHALSRPLIPPTPRLAADGYWRAHPLRADRLARALAARSGAPSGWRWQIALEGARRDPSAFRMPPAPYRDPAFARGKGHCCVCGQPVFRFGWHIDLWDAGPNRNAAWHGACVVAWRLWTAPRLHLRPLKRLQKHRCAETGARLWKSAEVDHRVPLFRVWQDERETPWPALLAFWGAPNLQVINRDAHAAKCASEAGQRAQRRIDPAMARAPARASF